MENVEELKALLTDVLKEDHEILLLLRAQMQLMMERTNDHEKRLRVLERVISYGLGALAVLKIAFDAWHGGVGK